MPILSGEIGGFENDGNQDDGAAGVPIDWQTVKSDPLITEWALIHDDNDEDLNDSTQIDSAKEQDPTSWACSSNEAPPKDDIYRLYLASQITAADQLLHMAYVRATGTGDTDINVEFNQVSSEFSCPGDAGRVRSADDLLISFTFGGGNDPSVIEIFRWDPTAEVSYPGDPDPAVTGSDFVPADGHWDLVTVPVAAAGADNAAGEIVDHFFEGATLDERTFGEITLNLGSLFATGLLDCPGLGFATVHSRASHSFASDLKDVFPEVPFNLSDCGSLDLKKVNELGQPISGVTFGLYDAETGVEAGLAQLPTVPPTDLTCVTDALGICSFPRVPPGDYLLGEVNTPVGYTSDPRLPLAVSVTSFGHTDLTDEEGEWIVNTRLPLDIELTKTGPALAHVGDTVNYRFTVTNTGTVDLFDIKLVDPICSAGTITRVDDGDGDDGLEVDEVWAYTCTRVVAADDPDPLPNTATVTGKDKDNRTTEDEASWVVDLIHPAIQVVKTVNDDSAEIGQTLTFTYVVTNTGDTTLSDVIVVDDQLGEIGRVATLAPGAAAAVTMTKTMLVIADSPGVNIAVATGVDILGTKVTDDDKVVLTMVLGVVLVQPAATLPRTGAPVRTLTTIGLMLMLLGFILYRIRRPNVVT
jgi:uncharacterized repeat protein (TIGR01451 family)/LPXTG-motif cell wall-anchored protein